MSSPKSPQTEKNIFMHSLLDSFAIYLKIGAAYTEKEIYLKQENTNTVVDKIPEKINTSNKVSLENPKNQPSPQVTKNNTRATADAIDTTKITTSSLLSQSFFNSKKISPENESKVSFEENKTEDDQKNNSFN